MDRPPRKPEGLPRQPPPAAVDETTPVAGSIDPAAPPEGPLPSPASVEGSMRRTMPLPAPDIRPRRSGMQTESLAAPTIEIPPDPTPPPAAPTGADLAPPSPPVPDPSASPPTAGPTEPPPPRRVRPSRPSPPVSSGVRIAAGSTPQVPRPLAWGITGVLIFVSGLALWGAREGVAASLDRWLALPTPQAAEPIAEVPVRPPPPVVAEEPEETGPVWTFETIEAAIQPLPEQVGALSEAGRGELKDFADLARRNAPQALQRSRWENWRQVWRNRTLALRQTMPPVATCRPHAALEATCVVVDDSLGVLEGIADLPDATEASAALDRADEILDTWRAAVEAEAAAALEAAALEAEALAEEGLDQDSGVGSETEAIEVEDLLDPDG